MRFVHKFSANSWRKHLQLLSPGRYVKTPNALEKSRQDWPEEDRDNPAEQQMGVFCLLAWQYWGKDVKTWSLPGHMLPHALYSEERG